MGKFHLLSSKHDSQTITAPAPTPIVLDYLPEVLSERSGVGRFGIVVGEGANFYLMPSGSTEWGNPRLRGWPRSSSGAALWISLIGTNAG